MQLRQRHERRRSSGGVAIGTNSVSITGLESVTTPAACCAACDAEPRCVSFTLSVYTAPAKTVCWLKADLRNSTCPHPSCVSGTNGRKLLPPPPH